VILRFFRSNQPILIAALPVVVFLYWLPGWWLPSGPVQGLNLLQFIFDWSGFYKIHGVITGAITMLLVAIVFNTLFQQNDLTERKTQLPGLCFVLAFSWSPYIIQYSHILVALLFLLFTIRRLMFIYRQTTVYRELFDAGILLAFATMFYIPFIAFFVAMWITVLVLRPFNWREILMPLAGFSTIAFIFVSLNYLFNWGALDSLKSQLEMPIKQVAATPIIWLRYLILIVVLMLAFIAGKTFIVAMNRSTTRNQNLKLILLLFALNSVLLFAGLWFYPGIDASLYLFSLPLALVLVYAVADVRVNWMITSLFYLFLALVLVNNYSVFFQL
jgi:hypothetical protein